MATQLPTSDPLKEATLVALTRLVDPLLDLIFHTGVTVQEFSHIIRERAVRVAAKRVTKTTGRGSNSRVSIITGLPRAEVATILGSRDSFSGRRVGQLPARKVLAAWYDSSRFLASNGEPAVLPIYGKRQSFEQLVLTHGGGMPVRAMLDELTQIAAVERLSGQRVKAKSRVPITMGLTTTALTVIGERTRDLVETLTSNLKTTSKPLFEATALVNDADPELIAMIRREIAEQGASFINTANSLLSRSRAKARLANTKRTNGSRLGVTIYFFQDEQDSSPEDRIGSNLCPRKNLRRHPSNRQHKRRRTAKAY